MIDAADTPKDAAATEEVEATAPPAIDEKTGVALAGDYPVNHRLRAEALATAGKDEDPDDLVSNELIADARERLDREAAATPAVSNSLGRDKLDGIARAEGVDPTGLSTKDDVVAAITEGREARVQPAGVLTPLPIPAPAEEPKQEASAPPPPPPPPPGNGGQTETKEA